MKNLMIYLNPKKRFDLKEDDKLIKIQIDNSLSFGWKRQDIVLVTNFPYTYNKINSHVVPDELYCTFYKQGSKENALAYMFEHKFPMFQYYLPLNEVYWLHDLDVFQSESLKSFKLKRGIDLALCDYGRMPRWNTGSVFFNKSAKDIFIAWRDVMNQFKAGDEQALVMLTDGDSKETMDRYKLPYKPDRIPKVKNIKKRIEKLNISYNFTPFNLRNNYKQAEKPIKIVHFHPILGHPFVNGNLFNFYYGMNKINTRLMSSRLLRAFHYHRVRPWTETPTK